MASSVLRRNGSSRVPPWADVRCRNAAPTTRVPAFTVMRAINRVSRAMTMSVAFLVEATYSSSPPTVFRNTRAPSTVISS